MVVLIYTYATTFLTFFSVKDLSLDCQANYYSLLLK